MGLAHGRVYSVLFDVAPAARAVPRMARRVLEMALTAAGHRPQLRITGMTPDTDLAVSTGPDAIVRAALVNHGADSLTVQIRPATRGHGRWRDLISGESLPSAGERLTIAVPAHGVRCLALEPDGAGQ